MRADNTHHLIDAARRRAQATRRRAVAALRRMDTSGLPVTFDALAREAGVSRSWLYSQPDLRAEAATPSRPAAPGHRPRVPDRQRASDASLLRRVEVATQRIRELETDNKRLRDALAEALGEQRVAHAGRPHRDTPSTTSFLADPNVMNSHVSDTVHDTKQQLTGLIILRAQDNDRVHLRDRPSHSEEEITRGPGSKAAGLAMAYKLIEAAQARWAP